VNDHLENNGEAFLLAAFGVGHILANIKHSRNLYIIRSKSDFQDNRFRGRRFTNPRLFVDEAFDIALDDLPIVWGSYYCGTPIFPLVWGNKNAAESRLLDLTDGHYHSYLTPPTQGDPTEVNTYTLWPDASSVILVRPRPL
jgi:hypothetical protein